MRQEKKNRLLQANYTHIHERIFRAEPSHYVCIRDDYMTFAFFLRFRCMSDVPFVTSYMRWRVTLFLTSTRRHHTKRVLSSDHRSHAVHTCITDTNQIETTERRGNGWSNSDAKRGKRDGELRPLAILSRRIFVFDVTASQNTPTVCTVAF